MVNASFPLLRAFARELTPGVKELPATIRAGKPWLRQTDKLVQKNELGGIVDDLHAATPVLSEGTANLSGLLLQLGRLQPLRRQVLVPTGDVVINDQFSTGQSNFREFLYGAAAQAGEGGNFDGNGQFLRIQPGGGPLRGRDPGPGARPPTTTSSTATRSPTPIGTQPLKPPSKPPIATDVPCFTNDVADLNGPQAAIGGPTATPTTFRGP